MPRVVQYRVHGLPADRLERVHEQFAALAAAREWRGDAPWLASSTKRWKSLRMGGEMRCQPRQTSRSSAGFVLLDITRETASMSMHGLAAPA